MIIFNPTNLRVYFGKSKNLKEMITNSNGI